MPLKPGEGKFISALRLSTGLSFPVLYSWILTENGPADNPLNIMPGGKVAHYGTPLRAAVATFKTLHNGLHNGILASAGHSDMMQMRAIGTGDGSKARWGTDGELLVKVYAENFPKGEGSSAADYFKQDVLHPKQGAKDAASTYTNVFPSLTAFLGNVTSGQFWQRVLMIFLGAFALIGALILFTRELGTKTIRDAVAA